MGAVTYWDPIKFKKKWKNAFTRDLDAPKQDAKVAVKARQQRALGRGNEARIASCKWSLSLPAFLLHHDTFSLPFITFRGPFLDNVSLVL